MNKGRCQVWSRKFYALPSTRRLIQRTTLLGWNVGGVARSRRTISQAGGKGNNVARAITRLGGKVRATGFVGGHNGKLIVESLNREGIQNSFSDVANDDSSGASLQAVLGRGGIYAVKPNQSELDELIATYGLDIRQESTIDFYTRALKWIHECGVRIPYWRGRHSPPPKSISQCSI